MSQENNEEIDKMAGEIMRYILFRHYKEPGVPVKREDLFDEIGKVYKNRRGMSAAIVSRASEKFPEIFGLELKELQRFRQAKNPRMKASQGSEGTSAKSYVLRSKLPEDVRTKYVETPQTAAMKGLALVVISLIQLEGDKIEESLLWSRLNQLGVQETEVHHPKFGSVSDAMQLLIKQRYIQFEKVKNVDGTVTPFLELAENALDEFGGDDIQKCIAKITGAEEDEAD